MFEAIINLKILVLSKGGKHFDNYKVLNDDKKNITNMDPRLLDYIRDREELFYSYIFLFIIIKK